MTERESFALDETRRYVYARAGYHCEACGGPVNQYGTAQLAHRIPQNTRNLNRYGKKIIHHPVNLAAACSLRCNAAVDIRNHPAEIAAIIARIKEEENV